MLAKHSNKKRFARFLAGFIACLLLIGLTPGAAIGDAPTEVRQGDTIQLVVTSGHVITARPVAPRFYVFYDTDVFEYVENSLTGYGNFLNNKVELKEIATKDTPFVPGDGTNDPVWVDNTSGIYFLVTHSGVSGETAGEVATLTLKVKEDADFAAIGNSFTITAKTGTGNKETNIVYAAVTPSQIVVSSSSGGNQNPTASPYTITPTTTATAPTVSAVFDVDIELSADPEVANWGSLQAELAYDSARVTPGILPIVQNGVTVSQGDGKLIISRTGAATPVDESGVTVVSIPFTASAPGDAVFTITNPKVSLTGDTAMTAAAAGTTLTVTITDAVKVTFDTDFAGAPEGFSLMKYALDAEPVVEYTYGGETMHYALIDGTHCVTYIVADGTDAVDAEALVEVTEIPVTANDGDVNGDATLEIVDAQIAYDLAEGVFDADCDFSALTIAQRLKADFDENGIIDLKDAYAIQYKLHGITPQS
jgi:hypothetical protein